MSKQPKKAGRPCTLGKDAAYFTVKLRVDQIRFINNRMGGFRPGRGPEALRQLLDLGIKVARSRVARAR